MILPTKHLPIRHSLIGCGAQIMPHLKRARSLESLWSAVKSDKSIESFSKLMSTLNVLYLLGLVEFEKERVRLTPSRQLKND